MISWIGSASTGTVGAQFSTPRGVAVNSSGNGGVPAGTFYVVDSANTRIQRFDAAGSFVSAWGWDVVQTGGTGDDSVAPINEFEICTVASQCKAGPTTGAGSGQFNNPQGIAIDQADGSIYVTEQGNLRVQKFTATGSFVAMFGKDVNSTVAGTGTEVCTAVSGNTCKIGVTGSAGGEFKSLAFSGHPAVAPVGSPNAGNVLVADPANLRVQEFTSAGAFVRTFGFDVTTGGVATFEVCEVAASCKIGVAGSGVGQFGASSAVNRVAESAAGTIYTVESTTNFRVQSFTHTGATVTPNGTFAEAITKGTSAANGPTDVQVGASGGVFVSKGNGTEKQILELDSGGVLQDTHMAGAGIAVVNGLGLNTTSGRLYVSSTTGGHRVYVVDNPLPAPAVTMDPVTVKTDTTATFSGTVNPQGGSVNCKFEYSTDQSTWTQVTATACESLVNGGGVQPVSQAVTGLVPNTHYFVRLAVSRPFPPTLTVTSTVKAFDTNAVPPVVTDVGAVEICDISARLVGTIDPRHAATGYEFRYGTSPSLGTETVPVNIGSGATPITVSQVVAGLVPSTTYYFTLVATNTIGVTSSTIHVLTTRAVPCAAPENRGYEQVSPVDKGGANIISAAEGLYKLTVAEDGDAVGLCSSMLLGAQMGQVCGNYVMQREPASWGIKPTVPQTCGQDLEGTEFNLGAIPLTWYSPDLDFAAIGVPETAACPLSPLDPAAPTPSNNLYRSDLLSSADGFHLLNLQPSAAHSGFNDSTAALMSGSSKDFSHVIYQSTGNQSGDAAAQPASCPATPLTCRRDLFEWDEGTVRLVSRDTSNAPFTTPSSLAGLPADTNTNGYGYNPVSDSGERIFFQNTPPTVFDSTAVGTNPSSVNIFMREGGTTTTEISRSECTSSCGAASGEVFQWAAEDGSKALFFSREKLLDSDDTSAAGNDLYIYRHSANPTADSNLALLTLDREPADSAVAAYQGMLGMSDDGNIVYFVTKGQIVEGAPVGAGAKVYRWIWNGGSPVVKYLGTLDESQAGDLTAWHFAGINPKSTVRRVTPDGTHLLLDVVVPLDPAADRDTARDVYRWTEGSGWLCLSCQLPGTPSMGESSIHGSAQGFPKASGSPDDEEQNSRRQDGEPLTVSSDDGQRVFFASSDRLVPQDVNSVQDVYEWHDGTVSLISSGIGTDKSTLIGSSRDGNDVFFFTAQRLVGWDTDRAIDVYDARVGGGFPEPPPKPIPCEGDSCYGPGTSPPSGAGPATPSFNGPGNRQGKSKKTCRRGTVKRGNRCVKKKHRKQQGHSTRKVR